jgi:predicted TIM-barrel fold metal-dependent hydrolase
MVVGGCAAAASLLYNRRACAGAAQPSTAVNFDVPADACDCHTHIFGDSNRFPFWSGRTYTPEAASVQESLTLHRTLRLSRIVIVNSLVYGTDNSCMADALRHIGARARGIALVDDTTSDGQLDALATAGVRGIRLNFVDLGTPDAAAVRRRFQAAVTKVRARNWHVQIYSQLPVVQALAADVMQASIPVVFDHFAGARASLGPGQPGFGVLADLVRAGKAWVKLSAAYRISERSPKYQDVVPLAQTLIAANPRRVLWGTDWPHPDSTRRSDRKPTDVAPLLQVDDGELLNQLPLWAPDESVRKMILVDNPASLYGY